jgi:predicted transcriptional regulator
MANPRIDDDIHMQLKDIAEKKKMKIQEIYHEALRNYITNTNQEMILVDSKIEEIMNRKLRTFENRIMDVIGRIGMDNSINVMASTHIMQKIMNSDRSKIYTELRKEAATYWGRPYKKQQEQTEK